MKHNVVLVLALSSLFASCKTPNSSGLMDAGAGGTLDCSFPTPDGSGQNFEIWATPTDGTQLTNVQYQYSPGNGAPPGPQQTIGAAPAVSMDTVTNDSGLGLRHYYKSLMSIDPTAFDCYGVIANDAASGIGDLCVGKAVKADQSHVALWVTNLPTQIYVSELMVYQSTCTAAQ